MAVSNELLSGLIGSALAFLLGVITLVVNNNVKIKLLINKISAYFGKYIQITIPEYDHVHLQPSDLFLATEAYLSESCSHKVHKLKAIISDRHSKRPQVSFDDEQEIIDTYCGAKLWWYADTKHSRSTIISNRPRDENRRFYRVTFHRKFRHSILDSYLPHVLESGRTIIAQNRQRRLFTNNSSSRWSSYEECWSHVAFQHPATFDTLAMDPIQKWTIIDDLTAFRQGKDYYTKVGKAWKRGYLLFGPPGTGKSTMIAAMTNFLDYDVYDLDLMAVKDNTELRRLFIETTGKSIIVMEDIDRFVDLTGERSRHKKSSSESGNRTLMPKEDVDEDDEGTKLTLSGLLNLIDGLWSACGSERIIVLTTKKKSKLDPALIRPGRMDKHIEMSYCRYEAFKVLANNYLGITDHQMFELFGEIQRLLEEVDMSPADVAEHLMCTDWKRDANTCLKGLIAALKEAKHAKDKEKAKEEVVEIHGETGGSGS